MIRELSDLRELAAKVRERGAVPVGLMLGENFKDKNPRGDGAWRIYHSDETRFYPQDESKTIRRLQRRRANLALLMKNNKETSKEEEQTWLC